jgi:hypothetical protein
VTYTILWLIAFLLNSYPAPFTMVVPEGVACDRDLALSIARMRVAVTGPIQDDILWRCETAASPGLAPNGGI